MKFLRPGLRVAMTSFYNLLVYLFDLIYGREELHAQLFFCSVNFGRPLFLSQRVVSGITKKPVQRIMRNLKDFSKLCLFKKLTRSEMFVKMSLFTFILFTFVIPFQKNVSQLCWHF